MKATTFFFGLASAAIASANIIFTHVPLSCNKTDDSRMFHGCLAGQGCGSDGQCLPQSQFSERSGPVYVMERQTVYSVDGTCGPAHGNTVCNPSSTVYTGSCCSQYGWCGNDAAHCGTGCLSGCSATSSTAPRADGRCGSGYGGATCDAAGPYGGCCSQYGWCGDTMNHCLASNGCQQGCSVEVVLTVRSDGRCGKDYGDTVCDPAGSFGGCCSDHGFCGNTADHCLVSSGCQSGCSGASATTPAATSTTGEPVIAPVTSTAAPSTSPTALVTTDGTCGTSNNNEVCGNWPNGNCCSMYGFCGDTSAHCGAGCQSGSCLSAPAVSAPGASPAPAAPNGGFFTVVGQSGVPAMHAGLMPNGKVFFLDKLENYTQLNTADGYYALSSEYNPADNTVVPLAYKTNAFCSGGTFLADGRVVSLGGNAPLTWLDPNIADGFNAIRYLKRSATDASLNGQDWSEPGNKLASDRWYATAQTMPDGTVFVASGSLNGLDPTVPANNNPTYEILSPTAVTQGNNIPMDILAKNVPYYMYPFVHLLSDGTLFVFVAKSSQIFKVATNTVVKSLPELPGEYRTYPNTGGSVLLPLTSANGYAPDIVVCGGGAYQDITSPTEASCGRIQPLSNNAAWQMEAMPQGRGMVEGTLLPDGTVVWMNGANLGAQGFGLAADPTLGALLYTPTAPVNKRFQTLASSTIPRLYHSVCTLLLDGTIMVAGSNPVQMPVLQASAENPYITEFRVEIYTPPYLQGTNANKRPTNVHLSTTTIAPNSGKFTVSFTAPAGSKACSVVLYHGGFVTHSVHMGHRMVNLDSTGYVAGATAQSLTVTAPPNNNVTPPGPYVVHVMCDGVPAVGQFVMVS